jgi:prepilin-type N-terminal cleavage/methylation domain-containing protein
MRSQCGFSIIELMAVILIGAILVMLAIPSYTAFVKNNCLTDYANKLVASFAFARIEAIKEHGNITIRATNNNWNLGWSVLNTANAALRNEALTCSTTTITETGGPYTQLAYVSTGAISTAPPDNIPRFNICDDRHGVTGRQVTISYTGRPHTDASSLVCP